MLMFLSCLFYWSVVFIIVVYDICSVGDTGLWSLCSCFFSVFVVCSIYDDYICDLSVYFSGLWCFWSVVLVILGCVLYVNGLCCLWSVLSVTMTCDDYVCDLSVYLLRSVVFVSVVCRVSDTGLWFFPVPLQHSDLVLEVRVVQLFFLHALQGVEIPGLSLSHQVDLRKRAPAETVKRI